MEKIVHTTITYDHDRKPLENFLTASGFKVVTFNVDNENHLVDIIEQDPPCLVFVSSLVNRKSYYIWNALDNFAGKVLEKYNISIQFGDGCFGEQLVNSLNQLPIPNLTVIFSSEAPNTKGDGVKFVSKCTGTKEDQHAEIADHLNAFFDKLSL